MESALYDIYALVVYTAPAHFPSGNLYLVLSIISELNKEFPAISLVERFLIFNNYPAKSRRIHREPSYPF